MRVLDICRGLARHPVRHLLHRWNWKNAVFTTLVRGAIFFATNLAAGWPSAVRALFVDIAFRAPLSGVYAAITQELASAEPRWAALAIIVGLVPAAGHAIEIVVHWCMGTPELRASVIASVAFSILSAVFNMFSMQRGVFLVGAAARPFWEDMTRLPALVRDFILLPVRAAVRLVSGAR